MHGLYTEHRHLRPGVAIAGDLATNIYKNVSLGKIVVVTDRPLIMLASVRKQWVRMMRKVQVERARTLRSDRVAELSEQADRMRELTFSANISEDILVSDVTFADADDMVRTAPDCCFMYVTYDFAKEKLYMMTSWMPKKRNSGDL